MLENIKVIEHEDSEPRRADEVLGALSSNQDPTHVSTGEKPPAESFKGSLRRFLQGIMP